MVCAVGGIVGQLPPEPIAPECCTVSRRRPDGEEAGQRPGPISARRTSAIP